MEDQNIFPVDINTNRSYIVKAIWVGLDIEQGVVLRRDLLSRRFRGTMRGRVLLTGRRVARMCTSGAPASRGALLKARRNTNDVSLPADVFTTRREPTPTT